MKASLVSALYNKDREMTSASLLPSRDFMCAVNTQIQLYLYPTAEESGKSHPKLSQWKKDGVEIRRMGL